MATDELKDQIEELVMLQRVDQELDATLDFDSVLMLTMDWALRRTGASAGMYATLTPDHTGLVPLIVLGYPPGAVPFSADSPHPVSDGILGRAVRTREAQFIVDTAQDPDHGPLLPRTCSVIVVPIEIRGNLLGLISLESDRPDTFDASDLAFVRRLAGRAAIALDHARLYREAAAQADEMAALYAASRLISSSIERADALANTAQSLATVLKVSSVMIAEYRASQQQLIIAQAYRLPTIRNASDGLPMVGDILNLAQFPELLAVTQGHGTVTLRASDTSLSPEMASYMARHHYRSMLVTPLTVPLTVRTPSSELLGLAFAMESRRERRFTADEVQMAEAVASQAASALRQAMLFEEVRELETLKSEMIRMASHDLRNPLGNVMGYFELLVNHLSKDVLTGDRLEWVGYVRRSLQTMRSLIDDILTLERVESERRASWTELDFSQLVQNTVEGQRSAAELKKHSLTLTAVDTPLFVFGSQTQLREAVTNLIDNALKYTPENGQIQVRLLHKERRLIFEVQDNGYGISKERQQRLFHRFYRARQPGTDHISGTGLGLSLIKTVIERHGGEVWVHSEPGIGSTFGFWLPLATSLNENGPRP